jgi:hypothetical protein
MADCGFENPFALQSVRIAHFLEDSWTDGHTVDKRKGAKAQRRSRFGIGIPSLRLCALATLRWKIFLIRKIRGSIPSVAAGRVVFFAFFAVKSAFRTPRSAEERRNHGWTRMNTDGKTFSLSAFIRVHPRFKSAIRPVLRSFSGGGNPPSFAKASAFAGPTADRTEGRQSAIESRLDGVSPYRGRQFLPGWQIKALSWAASRVIYLISVAIKH